MSATLKVYSSPAELAAAVADALASVIGQTLAARPANEGPFELAIAGGFVGQTVLPALTGADIDWARVRVWWVDERFVPAGHPDRNDDEARAAFLDSVPDVQLAPMPTDQGQGLEAAREAFATVWAAEMGDRVIDVSLLGMGPDGHIASLFPGHEWASLGAESPEVISVDNSPKPPPQRLSLSMPVILASRHLWLATGGAAKAEVLGQAWGGAKPADVPVAALLSEDAAPKATFWLDEAAASAIP